MYAGELLRLYVFLRLSACVSVYVSVQLLCACMDLPTRVRRHFPVIPGGPGTSKLRRCDGDGNIFPNLFLFEFNFHSHGHTNLYFLHDEASTHWKVQNVTRRTAEPLRVARGSANQSKADSFII